MAVSEFIRKLSTGAFFANVSSKQKHFFGGVSLSQLTKIARAVDFRNYCTIDQYGLLVLHHYEVSSNIRCQTQFKLNEDLELEFVNGTPYYERDTLSQSGKFEKLANYKLEFKHS